MPTTFFLLIGLMILGFAASPILCFPILYLVIIVMPRDVPKERKELLSDIPMLFIMGSVFQWLSTLLMGTDTRF